MTEPPIWVAAAASLLVTALLGVTSGLFLLRRLYALSRSRDETEQQLARLSYEVRRLEQAVAARRGGLPSMAPARTKEPIVPLISVPDLGNDGQPYDAAGLSEKHGEVWTLIEAGRTPREIAQETGRPIGQVELIAGLYREHLAAHSQGRHDDA